MKKIIKTIQIHALFLAWMIAISGFCISVFYAEVLGHSPCPLCWYQRIALFPLVLILGIAAYKGDASIIPYSIPFAILGLGVALFHVLQSHFPFLQKLGVCKLGIACSSLGFDSTFPILSMIGFFLISILLWIEKQNRR